MNRRLDRQIANVLLVTLCVTSAVAVSTAVILASSPEFVDELGDEFASRYILRRERRLSDALKDLREQPAQGIVALENVLAELSEIHRGDRAGRLKESAFSHLTKALEEDDQLQKALEYYDAWVAYDERNVIALTRRAVLLHRTPGRRAEGLTALAELRARVPEVRDVAVQYAEMLHARDRHVDAWRVQLEQIAFGRGGSARGPSKGWFIYWRDDREFSRERSFSLNLEIEPDGRFRAEFPIPPEAAYLRLDAPSKLPMIIVEPMLEVRRKEGVEHVNLLEQKLHLHDVEDLGVALRTSGADPYLWWATRGGEGATGTISGRLHPAADAQITPLLLSPESIEVERVLRREGAMIAARELAALRQEIADVHPISLAWREGNEAFSEDRLSRRAFGMVRAEDAARFDFATPVDARVSEVLLRLPPVPGFELRSIELRVEMENGAAVYPASQVDLSGLADLERRGALLRVVGTAPGVAFSLPSPDASVRRIVIRGRTE